MFWLGLIVGIFVPPIGYGLFVTLIYLFAPTNHTASCYVCRHYNIEAGRGSNLRYLLKRTVHKYYWSKKAWHVRAWDEHPMNRKNWK